jgi:hypothetical protein
LTSFQSHVNTRTDTDRSADNPRHTRNVVAWHQSRSMVCCLCDKNNLANLYGHIKVVKVQWSNSRIHFENLSDEKRECMFSQQDCATALTRNNSMAVLCNILG